MIEPVHERMCVPLASESLIRAFSASWRVADSLDTLRDQVNAMAPERSKASDGSIGDDRHCPGVSDHCAKNIAGLGTAVVTARDITHDPQHGADMGQISEALRASRDMRIAYVIFRGRIFSSTIDPWTWRPYAGSNPHDKHMHASVVHSAIADDTTQWRIGVSLTDSDVKKVADKVRATLVAELPRAILRYDPNDPAEGVLNPYGTAATNPTIAVRTALHDTLKSTLDARKKLDVLVAQVGGLSGGHDQVMTLLRELAADPGNTISLTDEQLALIADRLAARLPSSGTFTLDPTPPPA